VTNLVANPITLAFWQPGAYTLVAQSADPPGAGVLEVDSSTPGFTFAPTFFGGVVANSDGAGGWWLQLADPSTAPPLGPQQTGVALTATVFGAELGDTIGFIQLVTPSRQGIMNGGAVAGNLNSQTVLDADGGQANAFYQGMTAQVDGTGEAELNMDDAPALSVLPIMPGNAVWTELAVGQTAAGPESFQTYLMYQPQGGIFVPLSVIAWSWMGLTNQVNGVWSAAQNAGQDIGEAVDATAFPVWSNNQTNFDWVPAAAARARACSS
jgi:hypothetical protein